VENRLPYLNKDQEKKKKERGKIVKCVGQSQKIVSYTHANSHEDLTGIKLRVEKGGGDWGGVKTVKK